MTKALRSKNVSAVRAAVLRSDGDVPDVVLLQSVAEPRADVLVADPVENALPHPDPARYSPSKDGSPEAAATAARGLRGCIDEASSSFIDGWVWDPERPSARIQLELVEDDVRILTAIADRLRPGLDLSETDDPYHGFAIDLAPGLLPEGRHTLHLRCAETGMPMPGSPITVEVASDAAAPVFRWHIDEITDKGVSGWIAARSGGLRHCVVVLKEGGLVLGRAVASQFRADLAAAGIADGCCAFSLKLPTTLLDGEVHVLDIVEEASGFMLNKEPMRWRSVAGTAGPEVTGTAIALDEPAAKPSAAIGWEGGQVPLRHPAPPAGRAAVHIGTRLLIDISDLVYYIGHHANLTGIQRVQSSIVLAMVDARLVSPSGIVFLSYNTRTRSWVAIPTGFLVSLLRDLFLPEPRRLISFPQEDARYGILPGAQPFDGTGVLDDGNPSVLCLLGAAWVNQDYMHLVLAWKRRFGTRFVMTIHDLIPIYARETCDQDTARVFEEFMQRALPHVDHVLAVSESTARDLRRYLATLNLPEPPITVTRNGSSFTEFMVADPQPAATTQLDLPDRFVLFVATIEGRKNHQFIFELWRRMVAEGEDPPHLICVGRLGWKATQFVSALVETSYLDRRVHLLRDVSDADLRTLYERCLFTVCPTLYEGWGLPVGESLALGRICVSSDRASIPEVAGDCGVYIDIDDPEKSLAVIRTLIRDDAARHAQEEKIRREYVPITWRSVAQRVAESCDASTRIVWQEPYPYVVLPYGTEISFSRLDQDMDGVGELVLARIVDSRLGHFTLDALDQRSFLLGEAIRAGGVWAQPERWGTWLCQGGGDIVFAVSPEPSAADFVFIRLRVCPALREQPIRITAGGERLFEGKIGEFPKDLMLRVRKRPNATGFGKLRLRFEIELSREVRAQISAIDARIPTVGVERMIVVPENDHKTRLDVLSKFLMSR